MFFFSEKMCMDFFSGVPQRMFYPSLAYLPPFIISRKNRTLEHYLLINHLAAYLLEQYRTLQYKTSLTITYYPTPLLDTYGIIVL